MAINVNDASTSAFLNQQPIKMLIGGQWVESASGKTFDSINPSSGEVLAKVAEGDAEDINLFIQKSIYDQVLSGLTDYASKMKLGRGIDPATDLGPLVSQEQLDRVAGYIEAGKREVEEVAARANKSIYGLAAGVWTSDVKKAHKMAAALKSGVVWVNTYNQFDAAAPFGGYKQSGYGREMGNAVLDAYTQIKTVWINLR
jgi:acyl-CoA reductase-like NAD-dependent aldehyde dehydrogenase